MFKESVLIALKALMANKLRSILTMLGIIIGVGAVIAMISIGMGVRQQVQDSISSLGSNMLIIMPGAPSSHGVRGAAGSYTTLKKEDAEAIKKNIKNIDYVAPTVSRAYQIVAGNQNWNSSVQGITPEYMAIRNLTVGSGAFISEHDLASRNRVAVIGSVVANNLFGGENPTGKNIRINNNPYKIIGVLDAKGQSAMGQDQDDVVLIPLTTAQERLIGITHVSSINVQVSSIEAIDQVQSEINNLLKQRHKIVGDKEADFDVRNLTSLMDMANQTTGMITALLGSIAAISLLVGGIGIMNIMLVSVTERTREIGIRKALGATYNVIVTQFLIEAVVISLMGGIIGIIFGIGASQLISKFSGMSTVLSIPTIFLSFGFSIAIGLVFGVYPARKAARLNPIDALHYE